ncbi:Restriction endonuclease [Halogranum tailed virus 1]|uniref:Restriction endonuclease n=1 Tax=Halogranum tailed virus 1 TaxID=1273749 RepID=R4TMS2_9CAUD|nr:Restriction endonuclease [Halogranum tailed virus 1]AGM11478.1 Restriction endonuclease [Halogranum tailed virus 1]
MNVKREIEPLFDEFEWDIEGILHTNGLVSDVPRTSNPVTAIVEELAIQKIELVHDIERPDHSRQYPDITFNSNERVALDIKTAQMKNADSLEGGVTLGTCKSYFSSPDDDSPWIKYPYNSYDEHWVLLFAYQWEPEAKTIDMVSIEDIIINEKWKMASRSNGSGTTNNIGSSQKLDLIRGDNSVFSSEAEFENFWRQ